MLKMGFCEWNPRAFLTARDREDPAGPARGRIERRFLFVKRIVWLLVLLLGLAAAPALAETARDITLDSVIRIPGDENTGRYMRDRDKLTTMKTEAQVDPCLDITMKDEPCAAVYIEFGERVLPYTVEAEQGDTWVEIAREDTPYAQSYLAFEPSTRFRVVFRSDGQGARLYVRELYLFSQGDVDDGIVHIWQPPEEKADILLLVAHPDDEVLWFGGLLPYYAGEKQLRVQVVYMTYGWSARRLELLDSLWHCGVRHYPEIGEFEDLMASDIYELYDRWGRASVESFLVRALRRYRPEVVVTHAPDGEYGHEAHQICARSMLACVSLAADSAYVPDGSDGFPPWQVKKCYVHKGDETATHMDWDRPLAYFGGKTGFEVAQEAYRFHKSQPQPGIGDPPERSHYYVTGKTHPHSSYIFTLAFSVVGDDEAKNDLLEHLPEELFREGR